MGIAESIQPVTIPSQAICVCVCVEGGYVVEMYLAFVVLWSGLTCGAVCVYPNRVIDCVESLKAAGASHIPIASGTVNHFNC